jgi:hypothetical protein
MAAEQLQALHATARYDEVVAARATPTVSAKNVAAGRKALEAQRLNVDQLLKQRVAIMKTRRPHDDQRCRRRVEDAYVLTADTRSCSFQAMASWFCDGLLAVQALKDDADLLFSRELAACRFANVLDGLVCAARTPLIPVGHRLPPRGYDEPESVS